MEFLLTARHCARHSFNGLHVLRRAGLDFHSTSHKMKYIVASAFLGSTLPQAAPEEGRLSEPDITPWRPASGPQACLVWPTQSWPEPYFQKINIF